MAAAQTLGMMGSRALSAVPALKEALETESHQWTADAIKEAVEKIMELKGGEMN